MAGLVGSEKNSGEANFAYELKGSRKRDDREKKGCHETERASSKDGESVDLSGEVAPRRVLWMCHDAGCSHVSCAGGGGLGIR